MADSYFTQASNYAKKAADEYRSTFDSTLDDLLKLSNLQREQVTNNYNNLVNKINANRTSLQEQYRTNARQAFVNKLLADQQTTDTLSRMNLNQSGFRLTQDTLNNNQYSANLNQLALAEDAGLRDLDTQGLNALNDYNNNLLKVDLDYGNKLAALKQEIADKVNTYYNKEYDKFYNDLKYQDQLKQQALENQMKQQQLNTTIRNSYSSSSKSSSSSSSSGSSGGVSFSNGGSTTNASNASTAAAPNNGSGGGNQTYTLQGSYSPKLSSNANQQWFNNLTNSISKNGYKITYDELLNSMSKANLSDADAKAVFKAFGITENGITSPNTQGTTINKKTTSSTTTKTPTAVSSANSTNSSPVVNKNQSALDALKPMVTAGATIAKYTNPVNLAVDMIGLPFKLLANVFK